MSEEHRRPFKVSMDQEGKFYTDGPIQGGSYHGGYLFPKTRFDDEELANRVVELMNSAFGAGQAAARRKIREALDIKT